MNRGHVIALVAVLSTAVSCSPVHVDSSSNIFNQGSIATASDRLPVAEAQVVLIDESLDDAATAKGEFVRKSVLSNVNGDFKIDYFLFWGKTIRRGGDPAEGTLRIEINKRGYTSAVYSVRLGDFAYHEVSNQSVLDLGMVLLSEEPTASPLEG
jgi:hypothetical protein